MQLVSKTAFKVATRLYDVLCEDNIDGGSDDLIYILSKAMDEYENEHLDEEAIDTPCWYCGAYDGEHDNWCTRIVRAKPVQG